MKRILIIVLTVVFLLSADLSYASGEGIVGFVQRKQLFSDSATGEWVGGNMENSLLASLANKPYVKGVTYWTTWASLEPTEGDYQWAQFEQLFKAANHYGLFVNIGIMTPIHPDWLTSNYAVEMLPYDELQQGWNQPVQKDLPFPLDPIYLSKYNQLITELGQRYQNEPSLEHVVVAGPSNGTGFETFIKFNNEDIDHVRNRVMALTGEDSYDVGLAQAWIESIQHFSNSFPTKDLTIALTVNMASIDDVPRSVETASIILNQLEENNQFFVHPMMYNLTGASWWEPDNSFPVGRLLGMLFEAPSRGFSTGYQMIGISWADETREERARPFIPAMHNGAITAHGKWIEVWSEDIFADRSKPWKTRGWVTSTHPCWDGCSEGDYSDIEQAMIQAYPITGDINKNGEVDVFDVNLLTSDFQQAGANLLSDINQDDVVDSVDLQLLLANYAE